ncbi:MAG: hypothetical protein IK081_14620 [Lachnospiraceae bacterium]|nr:hypothetical protein [Lachnospiraceae bacterium]
MEKRKNRTLIRILGFVLFIVISLVEGISAVFSRFRRKWAEVKKSI